MQRCAVRMVYLPERVVSPPKQRRASPKRPFARNTKCVRNVVKDAQGRM
jgi:hypothetical protein